MTVYHTHTFVNLQELANHKTQEYETQEYPSPKLGQNMLLVHIIDLLVCSDRLGDGGYCLLTKWLPDYLRRRKYGLYINLNYINTACM